MRYEGIDTAGHITAKKAQILRAEGISFVARYLVPPDMWKSLTAQEAADIRNAGLALMLCWELGGEDLKGGAVKGAEHGARASGLAEALGVPAGTVIYFAVDYNAPAADYEPIAAYLRAAQDAIGTRYRAGVYGSYGVAEAMALRIPGIPVWQCVAWSGGLWSAHAAVRQYAWQGDPRAKALAAKVGCDVDLDAAETLEGMWEAAGETPHTGETPQSAAQTAPLLGELTGEPWYAEAMAWAKEKGYIRDGRPNDPLTRAELATVLWRMFGPEDEKTDSGLLSDE